NGSGRRLISPTRLLIDWKAERLNPTGTTTSSNLRFFRHAGFSLRNFRNIAAFGILLNHYDFEHTALTGHRFPKFEIRLKLPIVSDAVGQVLVEFPGRNDENARRDHAVRYEHRQ